MEDIDVDSDAIDSVTQYASSLVGESSSSPFSTPSSSSSDSNDVRTLEVDASKVQKYVGVVIGSIHPYGIVSSLTKRFLAQFVKEHKLKGLNYFIPTPNCLQKSNGALRFSQLTACLLVGFSKILGPITFPQYYSSI